MTIRERTALSCVGAGLLLLGWCAHAFGGWPAAAGVAGVVMVLIGLLLGLDSEPTTQPPLPALPLSDDEMIEDGVQRG